MRLCKTGWEKEKMSVTSIFSFSDKCFPLYDREIIILATFNWSSANVFNWSCPKLYCLVSVKECIDPWEDDKNSMESVLG